MNAKSPSRAPSPARKRWFRVIAVAVPLVNLLLIELILRAVGYGYPTSYFLRMRVDGRDVFVENQQFTRRYFPPGLERGLQPVVFPVVKPPGTMRIFVFGESAAMGDPEPAFGFPRVLEVLLREALPGQRVEVINVAVTAINSHVIRDIARDCADKQGDFWLVYMGNNEVVGPFGAGTVFGDQTPPRAAIRASLALKSTRIGQALDALRWRWTRKEGTPTSWEGMEMFVHQQVRADDPRMPRVHENFDANLREILETGTKAGARVIVGSVAVNLKDCPPFASLHRRDMGPAQKSQWEALVQAGVALEQEGRFAAARTNYQRAWELDSHFAELAFRLGRTAAAVGDVVAARVFFDYAVEFDTLRFRADTRLNQIIHRVATNEASVRFVDIAREMAGRSTNGIAGEESFYEHVHFNFAGNYLVARALAGAILDGTTNRSWLAEPECARRLAFTDFNRFQVLDEVRQRLRQPPFTQQLDHAARDRRLGEQLDALQPASFSNAVLTYEQAIARAPEDWVLRENLAKLLQDFGREREAEAHWRKVLALLPHSEVACYSLGNVLDAQGKSAEAIVYFKEALRRRPDSFEARNGLGLALASQGREPEAIREYQQALRVKPDFVEARVNLGRTLALQGHVEDARMQYLDALRLDSNNVAAHINLGKLLASQGQHAEAARHYRDALRRKPDHPIAHFNLGNALTALGDAAAAAHFAEAARLRPDFAEAHYHLGLALAREGKASEALTQFAEVVRLQPDFAEGHFNYGVALAKAQRFAEAAAQFRETLRLDPNNASARKFLDQAEQLAR